MDFHEALARLTRHPVFKDWHAAHPDAYLAHGFVMLDEANKDDWQIAFYDKLANKVTPFIVHEQEVQQLETQDTLQQTTVHKLDPVHVQVTPDDALTRAEDAFKKHNENALKTFYIIQNTGEHTVYNITYFTQGFNTINIHIDAETGKTIHETKQKLMDFA